MKKNPGRRRAPTLGAQWEPIRSFGDACLTALAVHAQLGRARAAFTVDGGGAVTQGWALTGRWHTVDHALDLALPDRPRAAGGTHVLLVTAHGDDDLSVLAEEDVVQWQRLKEVIHARGARALDWVQCGGDLVRSLRFSVESECRWPALDGAA